MNGNPHSVVSIVYLCHAVSGTLRPQLHEVREVAWRSIDDIDAGDWHHHHEQLARRARSALRGARPGNEGVHMKTQLGLAESVCLTLVASEPRHGWSIVKALAPDGEIGRVWSLSRPLTYRALDALAAAELIEPARLRSGPGPAPHHLAGHGERPPRIASVVATAGGAPPRHAHRIPVEDPARCPGRRARPGTARGVPAGLCRPEAFLRGPTPTTSSPAGESSRPKRHGASSSH